MAEKKIKKKSLFDGTEEHRMKPKEIYRDQLLQQLMHVTEVQFGNVCGTKRKRTDNELNWTKKSVFF